MPEKLFALDIGTRSVVGIILEKEQDQYEVKDILAIEHSERAMLDGQIHDIPAVSSVIIRIKEKLEQKHGPLHQVSVAAAGRALKTERASETIEIDGKPMMQKDDILHLELGAVQQAQAAAAENTDARQTHQYYCVGYSVLYYRLDGQEIGSLIDQTGRAASVEIIATFLPKVVVESLLAALKRAGLQMQALTLEPIAAINVLIPQSMRRLNVALVDIGAGTSDIALTDAGTVIAYGMVPVAGDEITEAISDHLLLDFPLAETAKRELSEHSSITVTDILGLETEVAREDIIEGIKPSLNRLAESISTEILALNNRKAPKAVMLVGGGSQTPELPGLLADKLGIPGSRVAIRGIEAIQDLHIASHIKRGPELVTPIGIAIAAHRSPIQYMNVTVNGQMVRLFDMKRLSVADCLLTAGIRVNKLYGKPGMALMVKLNGQTVTIPGKLGSKPAIVLNGQPCTLDASVKDGDEVTIERGEDGKQITLQLKDLVDQQPNKTVEINGMIYTIAAVLKRNGHAVSEDEWLQDNDVITCEMPVTIEALLHSLGLHELLMDLRPFTAAVNQATVTLPAFSGKAVKNGLETKPGSSFKDGDRIVISRPELPKVSDLAKVCGLQLVYTIPVSFNGRRIILSKTVTEFKKGSTVLKENDPVMPGDNLTYVRHKLEPFIFQDLFRHVEVEMPAASNGRFILIKNNQETSFHDSLAPGDELKILWPTVHK